MKKKVTTAGQGEVAPSNIKIATLKQEFITIPTDFTSLHDLKELVSNYDLVTRLTSALNNYNRHYLDSYLMTLDEVLEYVPETEYKNYRIQERGEIQSACVSSTFNPDELKKKLNMIMKRNSGKNLQNVKN
jgi:hypothetical protein